jgi:hypothetical protein
VLGGLKRLNIALIMVNYLSFGRPSAKANEVSIETNRHVYIVILITSLHLLQRGSNFNIKVGLDQQEDDWFEILVKNASSHEVLVCIKLSITRS